MKSLIFCLLIIVLANSTYPGFLHAKAPLVILTYVDGSQKQGEINSWDNIGIKLQESDSSQAIITSNKQLLRIDAPGLSGKKQSEKNILQLTDGSQFSFSSLTISNRIASVSSALSEGVLTIPAEMLAYIQFSSNLEEKDIIHQEINQQAFEGDVLVIQKKQSDALHYLSGVVGDITQEKVDFNWDGELIPIKLSKIAALEFYQQQSQGIDKPLCWLHTRFGAKFAVKTIDYRQNRLNVSTLAGFKFSLDMNEITNADYSVGKMTYLSDLNPFFQDWYPQIGLPKSAETIASHGLPRQDQSYSGSSLSLIDAEGQEKTYAKGLALRSRTELRYRIPNGTKRFICKAGIDPLTKSEGSVILTISTKQKVLFQEAIEGTSAPIEINHSLEGAKELKILVDFGENLDYGDRLHLVEARFSK